MGPRREAGACPSPVPPSFAAASAARRSWRSRSGCGRFRWTPPSRRRRGARRRRPRCATDTAGFELLGAPLIFAPTAHGFGLNVVLRNGRSVGAARARARRVARRTGSTIGAPAPRPPPTSPSGRSPASQPGQRYVYEICVAGRRGGALACDRLAVRRQRRHHARRPARRSRSPRWPTATSSRAIRCRRARPSSTTSTGSMESTLRAVTADVAAADPDFIVNLGDMLDYHLFGFNEPPPDSAWARLALPELPPDDGRHAGTRRPLSRHRQLGRRERLQQRRRDRALAEPAPALRARAAAGHVPGRRQRQRGLLRVHLGRRAVRRPQRDDVHADLPPAGRSTPACPTTGRWARRSSPGCDDTLAARDLEVALHVHPPHRRRQRRATTSTPPTAAAAGGPPTSASRRPSTT